VPARHRRAGSARDHARPRGIAQPGNAGGAVASVDDHRAWIERMRSMTGATVFAGIGILALVVIATIISVSFATRGAMAANRPIVEVLHFVGAGDRFIANRFLPAFSAARSAGRRDRRRRRDAGIRLFRIDRRLVLGYPGRRSIRGLAGDVFAAPVGLPGAGGASRADRGDHRLGPRGERCLPRWTTFD